jgi:hypothetical protein
LHDQPLPFWLVETGLADLSSVIWKLAVAEALPDMPPPFAVLNAPPVTNVPAGQVATQPHVSCAAS